MRVLIAAIGHFNDAPTGSSRIAFDEAAELARRAEDVWVLAPGPSSLPEHEVKDGIHLLRYVPRAVSSWNPSRRSGHQKVARAVLARHLPKVDVVHGHVPLSCLAALEFYGKSVRSCYTVHSPARMEMAITWKNSGLLKRMAAPVGLAMINYMEAECLRRSSVVTALSQYTIDCIGKVHGKEVARKMRLIPGWVDTSRFVPLDDRQGARAQLRWPANIPILFTLRRLVPRMGLGRLLSAIYDLIGEGLKFHLMIGGNGPQRSSLEEQVRTLGLGNSVTFLGRVEDRVLPLAYGACDAFILPTAELECFGLIALEALSAGRPVLATPVGAIPEIICKFEPSWLARSADEEDIAVLLRRYLTGKLPEHASAQLHDKVHCDYSRDRALGQLIQATVGKSGL